MKHIDASTSGYTLPPGIYEVSVINLVLKSLLPDDVKVNITIDDIRLRSNITNSNTTRCNKRSFTIQF